MIVSKRKKSFPWLLTLALLLCWIEALRGRIHWPTASAHTEAAALEQARHGERAAKPRRGGRLVISKSAGPRTFNRLLSYDEQTNSVCDCMMGYLIRINRQSQQPEPELAQSWSASPDGKVLTFRLRRGVKFSDGRPFTADDVLFTFQLVNDPKVSSPAADAFGFHGKGVKVEKLDDYTVRFTFPVVHAAAVRLFDSVPILPKHVLESAYREGKFEQAWTLSAPPEQVVGLGPFKLRAYVPGQRVILTRNEHYWKTDAAGNRLPHLDEIVIDIDPDANTRLLKFQKGETDLLSPVNAEDLQSLAQLEQQGRIKIFDLGPSLIREVLWFNLSEGKNTNGPSRRVDPIKLNWFKEARFRQAISHAIDRDAIVDLVFRGKATPQWGFSSAGNKLWFNPNVKKYPYDLRRAKGLLAEAGFRPQDKGALLDPQGRPVEFTLSTNAGVPIRQKIAALIQEDLAKLGIKVNLAFIETRAFLTRINEGYDYEAALLAILSGDTDPSSDNNVLLSSGAQHWWNPRQARPSTTWEARIDELMLRQMTILDYKERKRLFDEVQMIMSEQLPFIFLVSRHLMVAAKTDIGNLKPALLADFVLWNCEELYLR